MLLQRIFSRLNWGASGVRSSGVSVSGVSASGVRGSGVRGMVTRVYPTYIPAVNIDVCDQSPPFVSWQKAEQKKYLSEATSKSESCDSVTRNFKHRAKSSQMWWINFKGSLYNKVTILHYANILTPSPTSECEQMNRKYTQLACVEVDTFFIQSLSIWYYITKLSLHPDLPSLQSQTENCNESGEVKRGGLKTQTVYFRCVLADHKSYIIVYVYIVSQ